MPIPTPTAWPTPVTGTSFLSHISTHVAVGRHDLRAASGATPDDKFTNAMAGASDGDAIIITPGADLEVTAPISPPTTKRLKFWGFDAPAPYWTTTEATSVKEHGKSKIRLASTFSGASMFAMPADSRGMGFRGLSLSGRGQLGTNIHGISYPAQAAESGNEIDHCHIVGFSGAAIQGRLWNVFIRDNVIARNYYGIQNGTLGCQDVNSRHNYYTFNRQANVYYSTPSVGQNAALFHHSDRFERAGGVPEAVLASANTDAHGIWIENGYIVQINSCFTDGNTGNGILLNGTSSTVANVTITGGHYNRDATGNRSLANNAATTSAAIKITTPNSTVPNYVTLDNVTVGTGNPSDSGTGTVIGPYYSVLMPFGAGKGVHINGGRFSAYWNPSISFPAGTFAGRMTNVFSTDGAGAARVFHTLPVDPPGGGMSHVGGMYFNAADNTLRVITAVTTAGVVTTRTIATSP